MTDPGDDLEGFQRLSTCSIQDVHVGGTDTLTYEQILNAAY
jgi:hypothetical protein